MVSWLLIRISLNICKTGIDLVMYRPSRAICICIWNQSKKLIQLKKNNLNGLIAAPFTPFQRDGGLNLNAINEYSSLLKKNQVSGAFIGGTTGEGMLMSVEERKSLAEEWIKYRDDSFKIIVHVGANSYRDAQDLADHARIIGADAVSSMGPLFLR